MSTVHGVAILCLFAFGIVTSQDQQQCLSGYGNEVLSNMDNENTFCMEHSGRTCCNQNDTNKIKMKAGLAKLQSEVSGQCFSMTVGILCSHCDGDIGIGQREGLCMPVCEQWYSTCKNDFIDPYLNAQENLPFCKKDSLICSQVKEVASSPKQFCELLGYKIITQNQIGEEGTKPCFDGQSAVSKYGKLKKTKGESQGFDYNKQFKIILDKLSNHPMLEYLIQALFLTLMLGGLWMLYSFICCCLKRKPKHRLTNKQIEQIKKQRLDKLSNKQK